MLSRVVQVFKISPESFNLFFFNFKIKIWTWVRIQTSDLQISTLALYHSSYLCSIDGTGLNLSLESNAMQGIVVLWYYLPSFDWRTNFVFIYSLLLRKTSVTAEIVWISFCVFVCAFPPEISSILGKSCPFPFPYFALFVFIC